MQKTFRSAFVAGLFIVLPVLVTVWVVRFIFGQIDRAVPPVVVELIRLVGLGEWSELAWVNYVAPLVSVGLALIFISLLGLVGGNVLGRQILRGLERLVMQVPFVRGVYSATRQFVDTFSKSGGQAFRRVVLVEYPRPGLWTLGFVTSETKGEVQQRTEPSVIGVFLPTTPNPTSGWLVYVPRKDVVDLDMAVDDAFKLVISGGVLSPPGQPR